MDIALTQAMEARKHILRGKWLLSLVMLVQKFLQMRHPFMADDQNLILRKFVTLSVRMVAMIRSITEQNGCVKSTCDDDVHLRIMRLISRLFLMRLCLEIP